MPGTKISALTALTSLASADVLPVVDTSAGATKKITVSNAGLSLVGAVSVTALGATGDGSTDDTAAIQAALDLKVPLIFPEPASSYIVSTMTIPTGHPGIYGVSQQTSHVKIKHKAGATGALLKWDGSNRITGFHMSRLYFEGNGEAGETYGLDLSGFSYSHFEELWVRLFQLDGVYVDGVILPTSKQFSNNTFVNCRIINNERDGIRLDTSDPSENENTANTFIGCETSGNGGKGVNEVYGESNVFIGHTTQGNTGRDFYSNGKKSYFRGYIEGNPRPVEFGAASYGHDFACRTSYALWNTFLDNGTSNRCSVMGEHEPERHIFNNPYFVEWLGATPAGVALNGSPTVASYTDTGSPFDAGLQLTIGTDFQGLIFSLTESVANLLNQFVTLVVQADTSGVVDPLVTRVYTRHGTTLGDNTYAFSTETLPITDSGVFQTFAWDVRFDDDASGTPTVLWAIGYSGNSAGGNIVKIRSAHIVMGQTRRHSMFVGDTTDIPAATATSIQDATLGLNIHRKETGRTVYDSTNGKLRFAVGTGATGAWRATDGSGDLTPS